MLQCRNAVQSNQTVENEKQSLKKEHVVEICLFRFNGLTICEIDYMARLMFGY